MQNYCNIDKQYCCDINSVTKNDIYRSCRPVVDTLLLAKFVPFSIYRRCVSRVLEKMIFCKVLAIMWIITIFSIYYWTIIDWLIHIFSFFEVPITCNIIEHMVTILCGAFEPGDIDKHESLYKLADLLKKLMFSYVCVIYIPRIRNNILTENEDDGRKFS